MNKKYGIRICLNGSYYVFVERNVAYCYGCEIPTVAKKHKFCSSSCVTDHGIYIKEDPKDIIINEDNFETVANNFHEKSKEVFKDFFERRNRGLKTI